MKNGLLPCLLIALMICQLAYGQSREERSGKQQISLEKIWKSGEFAARGVKALRSMKDGLSYTQIEDANGAQCLVKYAFESGMALDTLFCTSGMYTVDSTRLIFSDYSFNADESRVLLSTQEESIYRRSSKAHYYAYDLKDKKLLPITNLSKGKQSLAAFSPKANQVAFVRDNNLFLADLDAGTEMQITKDGRANHIINGAVDWVYEEEFGFDRGFYWSPEGSKIAYYRFDESEVPEFSMAIYGSLYPESYTFKYPKAGERNSTVQIMVYQLSDQSQREVLINANAEQYIPRIKWTRSDDELCVMRLNRHQNHLEFLLADTRAKSKDIPCRSLYEEHSKTYIEVNDNLIFLEDGKHFIWNSERDGWNHIYLHDFSGKEVGRLTQGNWEVIDFYGVNQSSRRIYFSAAIDSPLEKGIYAVPFGKLIDTGKSGELKPVALLRNGGSNDAVFSSSFANFINEESHAGVPPRIALHYDSGEEIRVLEDNSQLRERLKNYELSEVEFGSFETKAGHSLNYSMIRPPDFDPNRSYPMMLMVYGGPGSNVVSKSWGYSNYFWHQYLAQQGFVIVAVDPRGTMRRGREFKHSTYLQLGKLETDDFIASARYFGGQDYIDSERIGIMGWSYGGYMSSLCITKGADDFKLAIAVAPVTNWRYYDTIYTERFMRTPQENPDGYDQNSPIHFVDLLKGHYLLVHGSADDNVHYQNSMEMIDALVNADKDFDLMIYPNKNHGIYGGNTRHHLFRKMSDFIEERL